MHRDAQGGNRVGCRPYMEHDRPTGTLRFNRELHRFWYRWIELAVDRAIDRYMEPVDQAIDRYMEPVDRTVDRPTNLATPNVFQTSVLIKIS